MKSFRNFYRSRYVALAMTMGVGLVMHAGSVPAQTQTDPFARTNVPSAAQADTVGLVRHLPPGSPGALVADRASKRWAYMIKHDFKSVYEFFTPFYKASTSQEAYGREMANGNAWLAAEVIKVNCEQQLCNALVRIDVASPMPGKFGDKISTHIDEQWVLVDGEWWFSRR